MFRKIIFFLLIYSPLALGQFLTQVNGTVKDPTGLPYANGTISATLVISGSPRFTFNSLPYTPPSQPVGLDATGSFVMSLADVNQLTPPGGTWSFHTCSAAGTVQPGSPITSGPVCFDVTGIVITGAAMNISAQLSAAAPRLTPQGVGGGGVAISGTPTPGTANFNNTSPPAPPNGLNIQWQSSGNSVSAALVGDGDANDCFHGDGFFKPCGVVSINGVPGLFTFTGSVSCTGTTCNFTGGTGGSGTVGGGTVGQYAIYTAANTVNGSTALSNNGSTTISTQPISLLTTGTQAAPVAGLSFTGGTVLGGSNGASGTFAGIPGIGYFAIGGSNQPCISSNGSSCTPIKALLFNGVAVVNSSVVLNFSNTNPAAPTNGRNITWQPNSPSSTVSAALVGDGSTNCLNGQGAYIPCGGTVGPGNQGFFAFYPAQGQNSVIGSTVLSDINGSITSVEPVTATSFVLPANGNGVITGGSGTPAPVTGQGAFGFLTGGVPAISINGGPFAAISASNVGPGVTNQFAIYSTNNTVIGSSVLSITAGNIFANAPIVAPSTNLFVGGSYQGTGTSTVVNQPAFGFLNGIPAVSLASTAYRTIFQTLVNGTAVPAAAATFNFSNTTPAVPTNGRNISFQLLNATPASGLSAALVGDGSTNCLSGQGTYVPCGPGAGGSGTVGAGTANQFAFYSATGTAVVGTPHFTDNGSQITSTLPFFPNAGIQLLSAPISSATVSTPVSGQGAFGFLSGGVPAVSVNGGPFTAISSATIGNGTAGQYAVYNGTNSVVGSLTFSDTGTVNLSTESIQINGASASAPPQLNLKNNATGDVASFFTNTNDVPSFNCSSPSATFNCGNGLVMNSLAFNAVANQSAIVNFSSTTPAAPANGRLITWTRPNATDLNVSAALVGDGSTNCLSGQGTYVTCGAGTGGGIGGSGAAAFVPVFTAATTIGNSSMTATANTINFGAPGPLTPSSTATLTAGLKAAVNQSTPSCASGVAIPLNPTSNVGCAGMDLLFNTTNSTSSGTNAGLIVRANGASNSPGNLGMGIVAVETGSSNLTEQRAGYFEADSGFFTGIITTSRGLMGVAVNSSGTVATNEGIVAQSGVIAAGGTNTNDFSVHCLPPLTGGTMTTHACMKIEPQGTGVEFQTGAHTFAALPTCAVAYEGSIAAITDSTVASGTITGGGSNHVLGFCNGAAWTVAAGGGGGGGGGGGLAQLCTVINDITFVPNVRQFACRFTLPAVAHAYQLRCALSVQIVVNTGTSTGLAAGVETQATPAGQTWLSGTFMDDNAPSANLHSQTVNLTPLTPTNGIGDLNVVDIPDNGIGSASNDLRLTIDGVYNAAATAQVFSVYVGNTVTATSTGSILSGSYCRLD